MGDSLVNQAYEERLKWGVVWVNKAKRIGLLTDASVTAWTTLASAITSINNKFRDATVKDSLLYEPYREVSEGLKRELTFLNGLLLGDGTSAASTTLLTALTTVNTGGAVTTDLRYLFTRLISDANFSATREDFMASGVGATSY